MFVKRFLNKLFKFIKCFFLNVRKFRNHVSFFLKRNRLRNLAFINNSFIRHLISHNFRRLLSLISNSRRRISNSFLISGGSGNSGSGNSSSYNSISLLFFLNNSFRGGCGNFFSRFLRFSSHLI
ncbi:hypothetical protein MtrunA17_Chr4g0014891 [Medicago truncatula]|uniref:Uncharacterized protein n=1 Tax=Medicago truncatula TaxID=3880 RepID=A0A396I497_MEDTR|nr:hypothetical protein MtrunA17_Chr4g0014891 [Medicago truncatula]